MSIPAQTPDRNPEESPLRISGPEWNQVLRRTLGEIKSDRITLIAAGVAFYWFLAVFPALIAAIGILDLVDAGAVALDGIRSTVSSALPGDAAKVILDALTDAGDPREGASLTAALLGIGIALWSASSGMVALQTGLDISYDVEKERKFVSQRIYGVLLIVLTGAFGGAAAGLITSGETISSWVEGMGGGQSLITTLTVVRWGLALVGMSVLIAAFYYWGPNRPTPHWKWITPGGIFATLGWLGVSFVFSLYLNHFGSYAETYGSLAGVVVLVLSLYLTALVILVGAELNAELERQAELRSRSWSSADGDEPSRKAPRRGPLVKHNA